MKPSQAISVAVRVTLLLCGILFGAGTLVASDVSGDWEFAAKYLGDVSYSRLTFKVDGDKLSGSLNELKLQGTMNGDDMTFSANRPKGEHFGDFKGTVRGDNLGAGAEEQVVGVCEHDLGADLAQLTRLHRFHRRLGAHGHETGRLDLAVRRREARDPRSPVTRLHLEREAPCCH